MVKIAAFRNNFTKHAVFVLDVGLLLGLVRIAVEERGPLFTAVTFDPHRRRKFRAAVGQKDREQALERRLPQAALQLPEDRIDLSGGLTIQQISGHEPGFFPLQGQKDFDRVLASFNRVNLDLAQSGVIFLPLEKILIASSDATALIYLMFRFFAKGFAFDLKG